MPSQDTMTTVVLRIRYMDASVATPSQLNRRFDQLDMPNLGKWYAGLSQEPTKRSSHALEYLVFCLLRGLVLGGANLLLYKNHGGISSKVPNPSQALVINHHEPANAILKTHPFVKTPSVPFIIQS
jgi:hypothetical protein